MRLDKFLANLKNGSRKEVKSLIRSEQVAVNNIIITSDDFKINPENDRVFLKMKRFFTKNIIILL